MKIARVIPMIITGLLLSMSSFGYFYGYQPKSNGHLKDTAAFQDKKSKEDYETLQRLYQKSVQVGTYLNAYGYNKKYCFFIDMRLPSGKNRFFVYDLDSGAIVQAGLVSHGSGSDKGRDSLFFSNESNSYCTSLGRYKIGNSYKGTYGLSYKLYGLDATNNKAFDRAIVMHGHACVPDRELYPAAICRSQGCPTVSPSFLKKIQGYVDKAKEPILLWIYY